MERRGLGMTDVHGELRRLILPVVSKLKEDGTFRCHGTGFVIFAQGRIAILVTAAHVLEAIRRIETPNSRFHPTTPDLFRIEQHLLTLQRVIPAVLFPNADGEVFPAVIQECVEMPKTDLGLCRIKLADGAVQFAKRFCLDTTPVHIGDQIRVFGYSAMEVKGESGNGFSNFNVTWNARIGTVCNVYERQGPTGQQHPCFSVALTLDSGMSGGPAVTLGRDSIPCVRGIVRSDESRPENLSTPAPLPTALISMLWPLLLFPVRGPDFGGSVSDQKLIELEQSGLVEDQGRGSQHIQYTQGPNGQVTHAHWT
jgi:Trypsin-like peptidase domain